MKSFIPILLLVLFSGEIFGQDESKFVCVSDQSATFPGGIDSLMRFIQKNIRYPKHRGDCTGTIFMQFTVNENGAPSDATILKSPCIQMNKTALDLIAKMPNWIPAQMDNKQVRSRVVIPIRICLD